MAVADAATQARGPQPSDADGLTAWLVGLVGAVVGGAIAISGERFSAWRADAAEFERVCSAVGAELAVIAGECRRRVSPQHAGSHQIPPPLPTDAWRVLLASSTVRKLAADERLSRLSVCYRAVDAANAEAGQASVYLMISVLTEGPASDAYEAEAARVVRDPCKRVLEHIPRALAAVAS